MGGVFMKKWVIILGVGLCLVALLGAVSLAADHQYLEDHVIRLHVVANSDSEEDQQLKLKVRDSVTSWIAANADQSMSTHQAENWLRDRLPQLQKVAQTSAEAQGWTGNVDVTLDWEAFPTRVYDTFSLPAGVYRSVRVSIGEAEGKNWWCVVFPSLCYPATTEEFQDIAVGAGFSEELTDTLSGEKPYEIRFYLLDCLGRLKNFLFRK